MSKVVSFRTDYYQRNLTSEASDLEAQVCLKTWDTFKVVIEVFGHGSVMQRQYVPINLLRLRNRLSETFF